MREQLVVTPASLRGAANLLMTLSGEDELLSLEDVRTADEAAYRGAARRLHAEANQMEEFGETEAEWDEVEA